jgi:hypothetical protein
MDIRLGLFLFLDPFQWTVLLSSLVGAIICGYLYFTNKLHRLKMGLLLAYNVYVIIRYMVVIYFRQDYPTLSTAEASIINQLAQISQTFISWVIVYLALDARNQSKLLAKKNGGAK